MFKRLLCTVLVVVTLLSTCTVAIVSVSAQHTYIAETGNEIVRISGETDVATTSYYEPVETVPIIIIPVPTTPKVEESISSDTSVTTEATKATEVTSEVPEKLIVSDEPGVDKDSIDGLVIGYIGDTDNNFKVNVRDATNIQKYMAKLITFSEKNTLLGDADDNGKINIKDATAIQKYAANISIKSKINHLVYIIGTHIHKYVDKVVDVTCEFSGYTIHTCICGDEYVDGLIEAFGHNYISEVKPATCAEEGYTLYTCLTCNNTYMDDYVEKKLHTNKMVRTESTCTEKGYVILVCQVCGHEQFQRNLALAPHNYTKKVVEPTCSEGGYTTYTCKVCSHSYDGEKTNATGIHSYNNKGKCKVCGVAITGFDKLADYILKNGYLYDPIFGDKGECYIVNLKPSLLSNSYVSLSYYQEYGEIEMQYTMKNDHEASYEFFNSTTITLYRNGSDCKYKISDEDFLIEGYFNPNTYKKDTKLSCTEFGYINIGQSGALKLANMYINNVLNYYVEWGNPVSLNELGFKSYKK